MIPEARTLMRRDWLGSACALGRHTLKSKLVAEPTSAPELPKTTRSSNAPLPVALPRTKYVSGNGSLKRGHSGVVLSKSR
jgi:hypothetical protein